MSSTVYDNSELVTRCSAMFSIMSVAEKNSFLRANGLIHASEPARAFNSSNTLVVSPAQEKSKCRNRSSEALRLISDGKAPSPRDPAEKVVRISDEDLRSWFDEIDTSKNGTISRDDFCSLYQRLEWFGGPTRLSWVTDQLGILCGDDKSINFEKFSFLVSHLSAL